MTCILVRTVCWLFLFFLKTYIFLSKYYTMLLVLLLLLSAFSLLHWTSIYCMSLRKFKEKALFVLNNIDKTHLFLKSIILCILRLPSCVDKVKNVFKNTYSKITLHKSYKYDTNQHSLFILAKFIPLKILFNFKEFHITFTNFTQEQFF